MKDKMILNKIHSAFILYQKKKKIKQIIKDGNEYIPKYKCVF